MNNPSETVEFNKIKPIAYESVIKILSDMFQFYNNQLELSGIAKMASIASAIKQNFKEFSFVGFYLVIQKENNEKYLEIGPYVSEILATPRIEYGKGVCGTSWELKKCMIVNNVQTCNNYIACSPDVKSEIVVPVFDKNNEVIGVLDIDSTLLDRFSEIDKFMLEHIIENFC